MFAILRRNTKENFASPNLTRLPVVSHVGMSRGLLSSTTTQQRRAKLLTQFQLVVQRLIAGKVANFAADGLVDLTFTGVLQHRPVIIFREISHVNVNVVGLVAVVAGG